MAECAAEIGMSVAWGRNLCDHAWPTTPSHADDRYRQHRCGQPAGHTGPHTCRYQHTGGTR